MILEADFVYAGKVHGKMNIHAYGGSTILHLYTTYMSEKITDFGGRIFITNDTLRIAGNILNIYYSDKVEKLIMVLDQAHVHYSSNGVL